MIAKPKLDPTRKPKTRLHPVALALACMGAGPAFAQLPSWNSFVVRGGTVAVGSGIANLPVTANGVASPTGTILPITQSSQRAIIDWQSFSIGKDNAVNITQPMASSVLLNRVTGNDLSTIAGAMTANGRVFLVNPNGVLFTNTSGVSVGGLVASTLAMTNTDADFMGGTERFAFQQNNIATVTNEGTITTQGPGGTVALVGSTVTNRGIVVAQGGTVGLVSGNTVTLDPFGDGLTTFKVTPGNLTGVLNTGTVQADGGRAVLMATAGNKSTGVVNFRGVVRADSLATRNGEVVLDSGTSAEGVTITGGTLSAAGGSAGLRGGSIDITGQTILLQPYVPAVVAVAAFAAPPPVVPAASDPRGLLDASGVAGGGSVRLHAVAFGGAPQTGAIAVAAGSVIKADATTSGNGGTVSVLADRTLRAYGNISATGGPAGGNGGFVETSGGYAVPAGDTNGGIELTGLRVDASATAGTAGTWKVDPYNVTIAPGAAAGTLPGNPFDPIANSTVQDGDINAALNSGTSVRITTGTGGDPTQGDIAFAPGVNINYTTANGPLSLQLDAYRSIRADSTNVVIQSSGAGGPLDVVFNANANGASTPVGGGLIDYYGNMYTNGGNVAMTSNWTGATINDWAIRAIGVLDTRRGNTYDAKLGVSSGGSDALAGGNVTLVGTAAAAGGNPNSTAPAVWLNGARIFSSTGSVTIDGNAASNTGVRIDAPQNLGAIGTTSGNVTVTGRGREQINGSSFLVPASGVLVSRATIGTVSGGIDLRGYVADGAAPPPAGTTPSAGLRIENGAQIVTTGGGDITLTGRAAAGSAGLALEAGVPFTGGPANPLPAVRGSDQVVLRADNNRTADAIVIAAPVTAGTVIDLRPGGLDAAGNVADSPTAPIGLAGGALAGFNVSAAELALLAAPALVVGSDAHAGDINVNGPIARAGTLTLQNEGGGNINLNAPVSAAQLGLLAGGNLTQAPGATVTATTLLARSTGGSVLLRDAGNNVAIVGGSAAARFEYVDADALTLGPVSVLAYNAAGNAPQLRSANAMAADVVLVRTLAGDLTLASPVTGGSSTDLVAAARFQNPGGNGIAGAPWRVWADTWIGETRGGLAGSGALPNLYHCAYLGLCTVAIPPGANHFIYAQQPTATVTIADASRLGGAANPPFFYSVTGLILGDSAAGFTGTLSSPATPISAPGTYPIFGAFASAAGYAVNVVPGKLAVGPFVDIPKPDVLRELPVTWTYDRNLGPPPICFATGPLDGDRASQGGDVLAREWSRVRSRPNLTSCVDTERRNGCADF